MTADAPRRRLHRPVRTTFLVVGITAALFLLYEIVTFVQEARVVVNIGTDSTDVPQQRIVNKESFSPPTDGIVGIDQAAMLLRVIESVDTLAATVSEGARTTQIVQLLNEYTVSLAEYRWIRSTVSREIMQRTPRSGAKRSSLGRYESLLLPEFTRHRKFFVDSLDRQLL
jgi:hypothetical protein